MTIANECIFEAIIATSHPEPTSRGSTRPRDRARLHDPALTIPGSPSRAYPPPPKEPAPEPQIEALAQHSYVT
ncbi:hypothetical protein NJB1907f44_29650 [Mycobacterium marinum]|nr:hypothetical protein NJB1907f34b_00410 [Mycobacterium marinum]GJN97102.1 hypothetical protein NJB1907E8_47030 [Mycobacterium marinum]GJO12945.1 hypothetical protein NJB1728e18_00870 [Mycobacterium marinum]GJO16095.1 hypothetical protein NJB1907E90_43390 [Mycobacterium marinum]GJO20559.1 hypothetical protein NJB1907f22_00250 [Mycobacterium marinum]